MATNLVQVQHKPRHLCLALLAALTFGIIANTVEAFHIPGMSSGGSSGSLMSSNAFGDLYPGLKKAAKQSRFGQAVGNFSSVLNEDIPEDDGGSSEDDPRDDAGDVTRDAYEPRSRSRRSMRDESDEEGGDRSRGGMDDYSSSGNDRYDDDGSDYGRNQRMASYNAGSDDDDNSGDDYRSGRYDNPRPSRSMGGDEEDDYQESRGSGRRGYGSKSGNGRYGRDYDDGEDTSFMQADDGKNEEVTNLAKLEEEIQAFERALETSDASHQPEKPKEWYENIVERYAKGIEKVQNFFSLKRRMDIAKKLQELGEKLDNYINTKWAKIKSVFKRNAEDDKEQLYSNFTEDDWVAEMESVTDLPKAENETNEAHAVRLKDRILNAYKRTKNYFKRGLEVIAHKYLEMQHDEVKRGAEQSNNLRATAVPLDVADPLDENDKIDVGLGADVTDEKGEDANEEDEKADDEKDEDEKDEDEKDGDEKGDEENNVAAAPSFYEVGMRAPMYTIVGNGELVEQGPHFAANGRKYKDEEASYDAGMITVSKEEEDAKARAKLCSMGIAEPTKEQIKDVEIREVASEGAADANWGVTDKEDDDDDV